MQNLSPASRSGMAAFVASLAVGALLAGPLGAADLYWDNNGALPNTGTTAPGTWGIDAFWNDASSGTGGTLTAATTATDNVIFSSGSNFTDSFTVSVDGTQAAHNVTFKDGGVTLSGGTSLTVGQAITKLSGVATAINTPLLMTGDLSITNAGARSGQLARSATPMLRKRCRS